MSNQLSLTGYQCRLAKLFRASFSPKSNFSTKGFISWGVSQNSFEIIWYQDVLVRISPTLCSAIVSNEYYDAGDNLDLGEKGSGCITGELSYLVAGVGPQMKCAEKAILLTFYSGNLGCNWHVPRIQPAMYMVSGWGYGEDRRGCGRRALHYGQLDGQNGQRVFQPCWLVIGSLWGWRWGGRMRTGVGGVGDFVWTQVPMYNVI